jgi:hypothetical protein
VFPPGEPVVVKLQDVMSAETAAAGVVRAFDLLVVVGQLLAALPSEPTRLRRPDWLS